MANIKSAKKRIKVINTKTMRNKAVRTGVKTAEKKVLEAIANGDKANTQVLLGAYEKSVTKAVAKGVFHANYASRKVSRLTMKLNGMA